MFSRRKLAVGAAGLAAVAAIGVPLGLTSGGGSVDVFVGSTPTPTAGTTITCNQSSTSSADFTSDLSAVSSGQTICLTNAVDYGTFSGSTKNLTIVAQAGTGAPSPVDATLRLDLDTGDTGNLVLDGGMDHWASAGSLNIPTAGFGGNLGTVVVKNFELNGTGGSGNRWVFRDTAPGESILIDHFYAHDATVGEAIFYVDDTTGSGAFDTGITFQNGWLTHNGNDGIKLTGDDTVRVLNNLFTDFHPALSADDNHTDGLQWIEANHIVKGNWISDCDQCMFSDDGSGNINLQHNIIDDGALHFMANSSDQAWAGGPGSTVKYNLITTRTRDLSPVYDCGNSGTVNGFGDTLKQSIPDLQNNVFPEIALAGGNDGTGLGLSCSPVANHHNMLAPGESTTGVGGSNFTGTPVFAGGSDLDTFDSFSDFCLAAGSPGLTGASDGGQVGVCGGDYNGSNYGPVDAKA